MIKIEISNGKKTVNILFTDDEVNTLAALQGYQPEIKERVYNDVTGWDWKAKKNKQSETDFVTDKFQEFFVANHEAVLIKPLEEQHQEVKNQIRQRASKKAVIK